MITEQDLQEAIAECEGVRNPTAQMCIKLAAFYTIKDYMYGKPPDEGYSYRADEKYIQYESDSEFGKAINGRKADQVWAILDEAMEAMQVLNPKLYANILNRIDR
jgi:hypothetical protein